MNCQSYAGGQWPYCPVTSWNHTVHCTLYWECPMQLGTCEMTLLSFPLSLCPSTGSDVSSGDGWVSFDRKGMLMDHTERLLSVTRLQDIVPLNPESRRPQHSSRSSRTTHLHNLLYLSSVTMYLAGFNVIWIQFLETRKWERGMYFGQNASSSSILTYRLSHQEQCSVSLEWQLALNLNL